MTFVKENWTWIAAFVLIAFILLKGPVSTAMAGVKTISVQDLQTMMAGSPQPLLVDVRTPAEYNSGHAPKAVLIPLSEVERAVPRIQKLAGDRPIALICRSGNRSGQAAVILSKSTLTNEIMNVGGGTMAWQGAGFTVER